MIAPILIPNTGPEQLEPPLQLFRFSDPEAELKAIETALPKVKPAFDASEAEWDDIMSSLLHILEPETGNEVSARARKLLASLPASSATYLLAKLLSVQRTIETGKNHGNTQFPQTHFLLLPQRLDRRVGHVLGFGLLPLAWIQTLATNIHHATSFLLRTEGGKAALAMRYMVRSVGIGNQPFSSATSSVRR